MVARRLPFGGPFCEHHRCPCAVAGAVCEEFLTTVDDPDAEFIRGFCHRCGWNAAAHTEPKDHTMSDDHNMFLCRCSPDGIAEADALMEEVLSRLSSGSDELRKHVVTKENLLTSVVISLNWDFNARITGIYCDQWSAVVAEAYDGSFSTYMQCDDVEDGIAATWKAFADQAAAAPAEA